VALPLIAWMLLGWTAPSNWTGNGTMLFVCLTLAAIAAGVLAATWPAGLRPIFIAATIVTIPIGIVVGELMMLSIYFLVFTPVALLFRLIGRDVLRRRFDSAAASYWIPKPQATDALQYYRQS
jgi:hypothetical protein